MKFFCQSMLIDYECSALLILFLSKSMALLIYKYPCFENEKHRVIGNKIRLRKLRELVERKRGYC
jgi:hypothetical protein